MRIVFSQFFIIVKSLLNKMIKSQISDVTIFNHMYFLKKIHMIKKTGIPARDIPQFFIIVQFLLNKK